MKSKRNTKVKKQSKLYEWQERWKEGGHCDRCQELCPKLTVDHIIPISLLDMLDKTGELKYEWEENFQYMCKTCNAFKANRLELTNPKTKKLLTDLINLI